MADQLATENFPRKLWEHPRPTDTAMSTFMKEAGVAANQSFCVCFMLRALRLSIQLNQNPELSISIRMVL